jgi:hypothetical protein
LNALSIIAFEETVNFRKMNNTRMNEGYDYIEAIGPGRM